MSGRLVIGIVGRMGSGKSLAARILSEHYGFFHIDVDKAGHEALEMEKDRIIAAFGQDITAGGMIDRKALGDRVFRNRDSLLVLNSIVHPRIFSIVSGIIENCDACRLVIDAALLFEIGLHELCDFIVTVEAPDQVITERARKYRNWDSGKIEAILKSQEYLAFLKEKTDFILFNNQDTAKLHRQLDLLVHAVT